MRLIVLKHIEFGGKHLQVVERILGDTISSTPVVTLNNY